MKNVGSGWRSSSRLLRLQEPEQRGLPRFAANSWSTAAISHALPAASGALTHAAKYCMFNPEHEKHDWVKLRPRQGDSEDAGVGAQRKGAWPHRLAGLDVTRAGV